MQTTSTESLYSLFLECGQQICTDTRKLLPGALFWALKGDRFNANTFAEQALAAGCRYAIVDEAAYANGSTILLVEEGLKALQDLARHHRRQFHIPFIAITGSNGKTTNKELINVVLSRKYKTLATVGNLNNHIGVPLTLLSLREGHELAIIEMGANHQGEIDLLCRIAEPDFGLITNIGKAHLEGFGGIEGVKKGKSELYRYIREHGGRVFVNGDDAVLHDLAVDNDKITFGTEKIYDVIGKEIKTGELVQLKWTTRYGEKNWEGLPTVSTQIIGHYNFMNLLCAACVGHYFKVETEVINAALSEYVPNMNRSQLAKTEQNTLILDAYNANPSSMKAAVDNFASLAAEHKALILGDMLELGIYGDEEHLAIVHLLQEKQLPEAYLVGPLFEKAAVGSPYKAFADAEQCGVYLEAHPLRNKTILIKGSRGIHLESLQPLL